MNEGLAVFLDMDERESRETKALIKRIDELLLNCGVEYTGFRNMYKPIEGKDRDHIVYAAQCALNDAVWLKDKLASVSIMNLTNACPMERIHTENMTEPSAAKLEYYEKYYQESHKLAHGIVVDEDGQIRDGYTSYIIAKKYGIRPDVYEAFKGQPLRKIVRGQHVLRDGNSWKVKSSKSYLWNYTLKNPVILGDILKVKTKKGQAFICVNNIDYVTGREFCEEHRPVIKHMKEHLQHGTSFLR